MFKSGLFHLKQWIVVLGILLLFDNCRKEVVKPPPSETTVQFLGHRGSGCSSVNPSAIENTLPAVKKGLAIMPGVEVDLQMSLDGTIWLFHNADLADVSCKQIGSKTIVLSYDADIEKINICSSETQDRMYRLTELIGYWRQSATPFYISMDVKTEFPSDSLNRPVIGGKAKYLERLAVNLAAIVPSVSCPGKMMVEVNDATFCSRLHQLIPGIRVCLIGGVSVPDQIDDAIGYGYDGISCTFTKSTLSATEVVRAQSNGLIVQLWTPNSKDELTRALEFHPDFIQTDNLSALSDLNVTIKN